MKPKYKPSIPTALIARAIDTELPLNEWSVDAIARQIAEVTYTQGGTTWSLLFGRQLDTVGPAYAVALYNRPPQFHVASRQALDLAVASYIRDHIDEVLDPRLCVGTWLHLDQIEINSSIVAINRSGATALGRACGQEYIYCLEQGLPHSEREIYVGPGHSDVIPAVADILPALKQVSPQCCHVVVRRTGVLSVHFNNGLQPHLADDIDTISIPARRTP